MEVKTYRAGSLQEALQHVRRDLGPEAAVLHTREVRGGMLRWMGGRQIEVTASTSVNVPSRFAEQQSAPPPMPVAVEDDFRAKFREDLKDNAGEEPSLIEELCEQSTEKGKHDLPDALFHLFTDLIDSEVSEELARELINRVRSGLSDAEVDDAVLLKARTARLIEDEIECCEPIQVTPGQRRLVALVGPTGVGKTTTIAKLAANFHLRDRHRVGLITVDTYRIAAVDQLRTYADIIDLPMEVVSTPREMRAAVARLADLDLVLMDTAGRSPKDEVRIQELKTMLNEARADEVHLVLSSVASTAAMKKSAQRFAEVGATSLVLTKLDEATGLGNLLPLLRSCRLPLSYVTDGQNVPDDIAAADRRKLARMVLGTEAV
jgi:flagellar biosynthesis protein FlhF